MGFFTQNILFLHVLANVVLFSWIGGGLIGSWVTWWAPWLALSTLEFLLVFPECKRTESLFQARVRVWKSLVRDPLLYVGAALVIFLTIQWLNGISTGENGARPYVWNAATRVWNLKPVKWSFLPWSIVQNESIWVVCWFFPVIVGALTVKHGLLNRTKRQLVRVICWNATILAVLGTIQFFADKQFMFFGRTLDCMVFASFGYPNIAAQYFPFCLLLSIGLWLWSIEHRERVSFTPHLYLIPAFWCAIAGCLTLSRAGVLFTIAIVVLAPFYIIIRYWTSIAVRNRIVFFVMVATVLGVGGWGLTLPEEFDIREEIIERTDWKELLSHPVAGRSGYQGEAAMAMYADHPWFGVGCSGYRWLTYKYVSKENEGMRLSTGQGNVHNDYFQFLAEHGRIGFGLMVLTFFALFIPFLWQLFKSPRYTFTDDQGDRCWINRINVFYVFAFGAILMALTHAVIDLIFRTAATLSVFYFIMAAASGFIITHHTTLINTKK